MDVMNSFIDSSGLPKRRRDGLLSPAVIRTSRWPTSHEIENISEDAREHLMRDIHQVHGAQAEVVCGSLLKILDAYLALTGQTVHLKNGQLGPISALVGYAGALASDKFLYGSPVLRYKWIHSWRKVMKVASSAAFLEIPAPATTGNTKEYELAAANFERIPLNEEQFDLWRGWPVPKQDGLTAWPDLRGVYKRYGKEFAEHLAVALGTSSLARKRTGFPFECEFFDFICKLPQGWSLDDFLEAYKVFDLMLGFLRFLIVRHDEIGSSYSYVKGGWDVFITFCTRYLFVGRYFAKIRKADLPGLPKEKGWDSETHRSVGRNGETLISKLLLDVPLFVSSEEAVDLAYFKIEKCVDAVEEWAEFEVGELWSRYERREALAKHGKVKMIKGASVRDDDNALVLVDRSNPDWEANVCATFKHHGLQMRSEGGQRTLFPHVLQDIAFQTLALPVTGALLPHLALLVIDHPQLTGSYLESLELYDEDENLLQLAATDGGWILDGHKLRKGKESSQQKVALSERGQRVIAQVIEITRPLRKCLRDRNNPEWKYLFLDCGRGFSCPKRMNISSIIAQMKTSGTLRNKLESGGILSAEYVDILSSRFTLVTLRATVAVAAYIKEPDIQKFASMLGHSKVEWALIVRYLPPPLLRFFEERWVRILHAGILIEALSGSKYLLPAVGFKSLDEVGEFMSNYAIRWANRRGQAEEERTHHIFDSAVLSIDIQILRVLLSVMDKVENSNQPVSKLAKFWAEYAKKLFDFIEDSSPVRVDFQEMLIEARASDYAGLVSEDAIYA